MFRLRACSMFQRSANSRTYKSMCKLTKERKYPWKQGCPTITETRKKTKRSAGACNAACWQLAHWRVVSEPRYKHIYCTASAKRNFFMPFLGVKSNRVTYIQITKLGDIFTAECKITNFWTIKNLKSWQWLKVPEWRQKKFTIPQCLMVYLENHAIESFF